MADQQRYFDVGALEAWMRQHVEGFAGPLTVEQFKGGVVEPHVQAAHARADLWHARQAGAEGEAAASPRMPSSAEYRVMAALAQTDVPVARMFALCEDESVIGRAFYIMEFVSGRVLRDQALPDMTLGPARRHLRRDEPRHRRAAYGGLPGHRAG